MKTHKITEFPERPNPHQVSARTIYDHEEAQAVHIILRPGQEMKRHVTPVDVFFYVLEGEGQVEIGDEVMTITVDTIVESPANVPHRLMNPGHNDFRFLVVKAPKPKQSTKVL